MSIWNKVKRLVSDPPPEFAFEVSEGGIAWVRTQDPARIEWTPLPPGVLYVNPLRDNVADPAAFLNAVRGMAPAGPKLRRAALILPDYAARVAVVDFDTFPKDSDEQAALVRFRLKKLVPFDVESAVIACHPQNRPNTRKVDVTVAAVPFEIASHYYAPFRAAGYQCGFVTVSALAALALRSDPAYDSVSPSLTAKLSGRALALSLFEEQCLRMYRCVELPEVNESELEDVLAPTFAFAEDELGARPKVLRLCGFPRLDARTIQRWTEEMNTPVIDVQSRFGAATAANAGLHGYLHMAELN